MTDIRKGMLAEIERVADALEKRIQANKDQDGSCQTDLERVQQLQRALQWFIHEY